MTRRKPLDKDLYAAVVDEAKARFAVWPSAYASGWVVKTYKARGGRYGGGAGGDRKTRTGLTKWFGEEWVDLSRPIHKGGELVGYEPCGRKRTDAPFDAAHYPKCRPEREAMRMSKEEVADAVRRKRRAEASSPGRGSRARAPKRVATYKNPVDLDIDEVVSVIASAKAPVKRMGGGCFAWAVAIQRVLLPEGKLAVGLNKAVFEADLVIVGHVAVVVGDPEADDALWIDSEGKTSRENVESWGMLDDSEDTWDAYGQPGSLSDWQTAAYEAEVVIMDNEDELFDYLPAEMRKQADEVAKALRKAQARVNPRKPSPLTERELADLPRANAFWMDFEIENGPEYLPAAMQDAQWPADPADVELARVVLAFFYRTAPGNY